MGNKEKRLNKIPEIINLVDISFENTLFIDTPIIEEEMKQTDKSHVGLLNNWVGLHIYITIQT